MIRQKHAVYDFYKLVNLDAINLDREWTRSIYVYLIGVNVLRLRTEYYPNLIQA